MIFVSPLKVAWLHFAYYGCPRLVFSVVVLPFHLWVKEEVPPLQNKFAFARYPSQNLKISRYNVGCTYFSVIMPSVFFTSADKLQQMTFAILNRFCLIYFLFIHLIISAEEKNIHVYQKPRFFGVKTGRSVIIYCVSSQPSLPANVQWFKDKDSNPLKNQSQKIEINERTDKRNASITIRKVEIEDSGNYFCKLNNTHGPGTALQVSSRCWFVVDVIHFLSSLSLFTILVFVSSAGYSEPHAVLRRSRIKDVIIFLQAFLLILCIVVPLIQFYKLVRATQTFSIALCTCCI